MKNLISLSAALFLFLSLAGCSKDEMSQESCERNKTGTVTVSNSSSNPYDIYINGTYRLRLGGGQISEQITLNEGNGTNLQAEQVSGFVLYPTIKQKQANIVRCSNYTWQIP